MAEGVNVSQMGTRVPREPRRALNPAPKPDILLASLEIQGFRVLGIRQAEAPCLGFRV